MRIALGNHMKLNARPELRERLRANVGEVIAGTRPGRLDDHERLLAVVQGLTACDVALAKAVVDRAITTAVGRPIEL